MGWGQGDVGEEVFVAREGEESGEDVEDEEDTEEKKGILGVREGCSREDGVDGRNAVVIEY